MKKFRVHLEEISCGDAIVEAETAEEAAELSYKAVVDWYEDSETLAKSAVELDDEGDEVGDTKYFDY